MAKELPAAPSMEHFKKQAKDLTRGQSYRDESVLSLIKEYHPEATTLSLDEIGQRVFPLSDAQLTVARLYGFPSWPKLKRWVEELSNPLRLPWVEAIKGDDIDEVTRLIALQPDLANSSHIEFDDPWRNKRFPTATLDFVAAGPWPQTPECLAWNRSRKYNLELVRILLASGAHPDGDTHAGPCLSWVRDPQVAALLVEHGAHIDHWYVNGGSPLNYTCWGKDPERMQMLLSLGANPNGTDPVTHESCLHYAAGSAATGCVRLLLNAGADPNSRCITNGNVSSYLVTKKIPGVPLVGETPLHRAAVNADSECIGILLAYGADRSLRTAGDETPCDWARRAHRPPSMVELLEVA